jgi:L-lysine 2,3-aminomutase
MDNQSQIDQILVGIAKFEDELKKVVRRVDQIQKSVDILYQDREILEDMQGSIQALKEVLLHNRQHIDNAVKDVKAEVIEQSAKVEDKVNQMKDSVQDNLTGLVQNIEQKSVVVVKEGFFKKFAKLLRGR